VLVVGPGEVDRVQYLGTALGESVVQGVDSAAVVERANELGVACVVIDRAETEDWDGLIDRLIAVSDPPSVVLVVDEPDRAAVEATHVDADCGPVFLALAEQALESVVETAVERYLDCQADALKRAALESFFQGTDQTMFLKDRTGTYLQYAPGEERADLSDVVGQTDTDLRDHDGFGEHWLELDRQVLDSGEPECRTIVEPDSTDRRYESTLVPWTGATGPPLGVVGSRTEISDVRAQEERLERERERLEQLSRYLSHDLKNPLIVADGYLDLAKSEGDEAALERVEDALGRMSELIDDLSLMAQNRSEIDATVPQADLSAVVARTWEPLAREETAVELELAVPEGTLVDARAASLRPLLENLFKNALVHGRADEQTPLTVTVGLLDGGFYVADDGPGIPDSERQQVFTEGYSSEDGRTGDGLTIVQDIVDANDWGISITDSDGDGAQFEITNCLLVPEPDRTLPAAASLTLDQTVDVGTVTVLGSVSTDASRVTVTAEGRDIWQDHNDFTFHCAAVEGPVRIRAQIPTIDASEPFSKAGLMVRDELDAESGHAYIGRNADHVIELLHQPTATDMTTGHQLTVSDDTQRTVRLDREGDLVTRFLSGPDGEWQPIDQRRIDLEDTVYVGLAACSTVPGETSTATFEDVVVERLEVE